MKYRRCKKQYSVDKDILKTSMQFINTNKLSAFQSWDPTYSTKYTIYQSNQKELRILQNKIKNGTEFIDFPIGTRLLTNRYLCNIPKDPEITQGRFLKKNN